MAWPFDETIDATFDNIKNDISAFANPGSLAATVRGTNRLEIKWEDKRVHKSALFRVEHGNTIRVTFDNKTTDYKNFLASSYMADLRYAAERFLAMIKSCDYYIPLKAKVEENDINDEIQMAADNDFVTLISDFVTHPLENKERIIINATHVVFLRAPAGAGKTIGVKQLSKIQSEKYLRGDTDNLFFYIDAQGQALSRLDQAVAHDTQKYRLIFEHQALAILTRNSLIIPIIDGFDELIGSGGYADAFKSLSSFLSSLNEHGCVIATGRSTFYEKNVLAYIATQFNNNDSVNYFISSVEITPWSWDDVYNYGKHYLCELQNNQQLYRTFCSIVENAKNHSEVLLQKPFYCAKLVEIIRENHVDQQANIRLNNNINMLGLRDTLISHFIDREVEKFKNRQGEPILDADGHKYFLEQLSLELWWQEKRSIDADTLSAVADTVADIFSMPPENRAIFLSKVNSYACLEHDKSSDKNELLFASPEYFDNFLYGALLEILGDQNLSYIRQFLSRSLLGESLVEYFSIRVKNFNSNEICDKVNKICAALKNSPQQSQERRNGGTLICALLDAREDIDNLVISNIDCFGTSLNNFKTRNSEFINCTFREISIKGSVFDSSKFTNTHFINAKISDATAFVNSLIIPGETIFGIEIDGKSYKDISSIARIIKDHGAIIPIEEHVLDMTEQQKNVFDLLIDFSEKANSFFYFDIEDTEFKKIKKIIDNVCWPMLRKILLDCNILEKKQRDRSGRRQHLYRLKSVDLAIRCLIDEGSCFNSNLRCFYNAFYSL